MFRFGSKKDLNMDYRCAIRLLDDTEVLQCDFKSEHKGQYLLDYVFKCLNLVEKDYFGLRFVDNKKQRNWLDPTRSIIKQVKNLNPIVFCFRIKFYPADPILLKEEITRYFLYLQLRRDLLHGRLYCTPTEATYLMAYIIQSELGDYDPNEHVGNYVGEFKLVLNQTPRIEANVMEFHKNELKGQTPAEAELNFLKRAAALDTYGIDPNPVKDHQGNQFYLGINYSGILTFQGSRKSQHYKWSDIQKITYEGRMLIIHLNKKNLIGFKCPSISECHFLWRSAVEQRYFFTMNSSKDIPFITTGGGLFSRSCKLRYSGRVEKEIIEDMKRVERGSCQIQRSYSTASAPPTLRQIGRSNTAPLPNNDSPNQSYYRERVVPYLNYSTFSEPYDGHNTNASIAPSLDPFDEEDWDVSMTSSLPTEFDLRPDLTPTNEQPLKVKKFEKPEVKTSPSHLKQNDLDIDDFDEVVKNNIGNNKENNINNKQNNINSINIQPKKSSMSLYVVVRTSILSLLLLVLLFMCLVIVIIESDSDLFSHLRKLPEMVVLRRDYYEPIKDQLINIINR